MPLLIFSLISKKKYKDKNVINLVLDGAGYHRKQEVVDKAEELEIVLHYLPAYSPNLNPIETALEGNE